MKCAKSGCKDEALLRSNWCLAHQPNPQQQPRLLTEIRAFPAPKDDERKKGGGRSAKRKPWKKTTI